MTSTALQSQEFSAKDALRTAVMALQHARIETASLDARLLLQHVLGVSYEQLLVDTGRLLDYKQYAAYQTLIEKRTSRQPVAQLTGRREFWGLTFKVTEATLDPRPDSETLIEAVLERVKGIGNSDPMTILDLGTGTGCLLLTLLKELNNARGIGVDISEDALKVAQENARNLGLQERASFTHSRWDEQVTGCFDIVISNPPYIPTGTIPSLAQEVCRFEPRLALDGGEDGLDCYRTIMPRLPRLLKRGGLAVLEIGQGQGKEVEALAAGQGLQVAGIKEDMAGIARCVTITHNNLS